MPSEQLYHRARTGEAPDRAQADTLYRDALIACRAYSTDALQAFGDAFAIDVADDDPDWPGPVGRHLAAERLRAIRDELSRRERLHRLDRDLPSPKDRRYDEWRRLAQLVRGRVDICEVFARVGYQLHDIGPNEGHAACPVCGGTDRLVIRRDPPARVWCRQCGWGGDTIVVTMSLNQCGFRDAVRRLADIAGEQAVLA